MSEICEIVISAPDATWLADFTRRLIEDRLCAGAHIIEQIRSIYRWEGEINDRPESRVALHTRFELVEEIVERVNREHPYQVPCVIATPIVDSNPAYLRWVLAEVNGF